MQTSVSQPFFTLPDPRTRPKGSRDPLGLEAIWSHFGRQLIGNLTTVTNNLDNFIVALLCCLYAHEQNDDNNISAIQSRFMKMEQLCAYLRFSFEPKNSGILGITRVRKNVANNKYYFNNNTAQILSNQLGYGLWGLYSSALESTGLIKGAQRKLTEKGSELTNKLITSLKDEPWQTMRDLCKKGSANSEDISQLADKIESLLNNAEIKKAVIECLLSSTDQENLQGELYTLSTDFLTNPQNNQANAKVFLEWIITSQSSVTEAMKALAQNILNLEKTLVIADHWFNWLRGKHNESLDGLAKDLSQNSTPPALTPPDNTKYPYQQFVIEFSQYINDQKYREAIECLIKHNQDITARRGGNPPWVEIRDQTIYVYMKNDAPVLNPLNAVQQYWKHSFFIDSFLNIANEVTTNG